MKIAILCGSSSGFLPPIEKLLMSGGHEVARFRVTNPLATVHEVKTWGADAAWIEWIDANAFHFSRRLPIPMVVRMHRFEADTKWPAEMDWLRTRLVVTSQHILDRAERNCPRGLARWARPVIIPSIVDFDAFPLVERRENKPYEVAVVGYIEGRKQPGLAMAAFMALRESLPPDARLRFIGTPKDPWWEEYLASETYVSIEPWTDDVAGIWKTAEVCLSASAAEGCPYNIIEAMASGAIPLVHDYVGAPDQFPEDAIWTTPHQAARALDRMVRWSERRIRDWAAARYSIEANRDAVLGLFA